MSASTTQPVAGSANQSAPFGAIAVLVGVIALGAVGILIGTTYRAAPVAEAPAAAYPGSVTGPATSKEGLDSPMSKVLVPASTSKEGIDSPMNKVLVPASTSNGGALDRNEGLGSPLSKVLTPAATSKEGLDSPMSKVLVPASTQNGRGLGISPR